jgi:pimeloyl-ACP methyl ester carboxylesterase
MNSRRENNVHGFLVVTIVSILLCIAGNSKSFSFMIQNIVGKSLTHEIFWFRTFNYHDTTSYDKGNRLIQLEIELSKSLYNDNICHADYGFESNYGFWSTHLVRKCRNGRNRHPFNSTKNTLLLIHGYGASSTYAWRNVLNSLTEEFDDVIAVDLPGFGRSIGPPILFDQSTSYKEVLNMYCNWMEILHKHLNLTSPPYVVSHSFGGFLSTHCVSRNPRLASNLLLVDVPGLFSTNGGYDYYWVTFFRLGLPQNFLKMIGSYGRIFIDFTLNLFQTKIDPLHLDYWFHLQTSINMRSHEILKKFLYVDMLRSYGYGAGLVSLLNITVPVSLLYGEHDNVSPTHQGQLLTEIANIPHKVILGVGHAPYLAHTSKQFLEV